MFLPAEIHQDQFFKCEVSLLIEINEKKEVIIDPFDYRFIFGDENLIGKLKIWDCLFNAFPKAYQDFILAHPDYDFDLSNPVVMRIGLHFELSQYRAVFEVYKEEDSGINDDMTSDDDAVLLRAQYGFDENFRKMHGLRLTPDDVKQKLYDNHFKVDAMPYMRADNVPDWEDRPKDDSIIMIDVTAEEKEARRVLRAMRKQITRATARQLQLVKQKAQQKFIMHEKTNPPFDYNKSVFSGAEAVHAMNGMQPSEEDRQTIQAVIQNLEGKKQ